MYIYNLWKASAYLLNDYDFFSLRNEINTIQSKIKNLDHPFDQNDLIRLASENSSLSKKQITLEQGAYFRFYFNKFCYIVSRICYVAWAYFKNKSLLEQAIHVIHTNKQFQEALEAFKDLPNDPSIFTSSDTLTPSSGSNEQFYDCSDYPNDPRFTSDFPFVGGEFRPLRRPPSEDLLSEHSDSDTLTPSSGSTVEDPTDVFYDAVYDPILLFQPHADWQRLPIIQSVIYLMTLAQTKYRSAIPSLSAFLSNLANQVFLFDNRNTTLDVKDNVCTITHPLKPLQIEEIPDEVKRGLSSNVIEILNAHPLSCPVIFTIPASFPIEFSPNYLFFFFSLSYHTRTSNGINSNVDETLTCLIIYYSLPCSCRSIY